MSALTHPCRHAASLRRLPMRDHHVSIAVSSRRAKRRREMRHVNLQSNRASPRAPARSCGALQARSHMPGACALAASAWASSSCLRRFSAPASDSTVGADGAPPAVLAAAPLTLMRAVALAPAAVMLADGCAPAVLSLAPPAAPLASASASSAPRACARSVSSLGRARRQAGAAGAQQAEPWGRSGKLRKLETTLAGSLLRPH